MTKRTTWTFPKRTGRPTLPSLIALATCVCLSAGRADSQIVDLHIDARQSRISIVEPKSVDVGPGSFQVTLDPPTRGTPMPLPGGGLTDGLTTFLEGRVRIEREPNRIRFLRRGTSAILGSSGEWFPGVVDPASAVPGDLAVSFNDGAGAFSGEAVLRAGAASFRSDWLPLTETPPGSGMFEFPADVQFLLTAGVVDYTTNLPMIEGRRLLFNFPQMNATGPGMLTTSGAGQVQISLPVDVLIAKRITSDDPPMDMELMLSGRVVASTVTVERSNPVPTVSAIGLLILVILLGVTATVGFMKVRRQ